jgi:NADH-quinone oxidoreductase subunit E
MYHLEPVGQHLVEVCTNLSCALVGAQRVLEALEAELAVHAGETTDDGQVTLRAVECLGGCGYAPVVRGLAGAQERLVQTSTRCCPTGSRWYMS